MRQDGAVRLKRLNCRRKAIETGSTTRAAAELNEAQTALGTQIRNLEDELGKTLLERHSRGLVPTPAGAELAGHAADISGRMEAARQAMHRYRGGEKVRVVLGEIGFCELPGSGLALTGPQSSPSPALEIAAKAARAMSSRRSPNAASSASDFASSAW